MENCIQIAQRIGSAANPGGRADGNRKQRGSRALTAISVGRPPHEEEDTASRDHSMYVRLRTPRLLTEIPRSLKPLAEVRGHFPVAVIDDESLAHTPTLSRHGFKLQELGDITDVRAIAAYQIVACDIRGVGSSFGSAFEGAHLLAQIKQFYPDKYVIAYSAGAYGPEFQKFLVSSDVFLRRGAPAEDWVESLDNAIRAIGDPVQRWKRIRNLLLANDAPLFEVFLLEQAYIAAILKRDTYILGRALDRARRLQAVGTIVENIAEGLITSVKLFIWIAT